MQHLLKEHLVCAEEGVLPGSKLMGQDFEGTNGISELSSVMEL